MIKTFDLSEFNLICGTDSFLCYLGSYVVEPVFRSHKVLMTGTATVCIVRVAMVGDAVVTDYLFYG